MSEYSNWTLFINGGPLWCRLYPDGRIETEHSEGTWHLDGTVIEIAFSPLQYRLGRDEIGNYVNHGVGVFLCQSPASDWRMMRGPSEVGIWGDIMLRNEYRLPDDFESHDLVVDIGAHVGTFAKACIDRGAGLVICFEPDGQNFEDMAANLKKYESRCVLIRAAAWTSTALLSFARPIGAEHTAGGSVVSGGEQLSHVLGVNAAATIESITDAPIRLLKLDCEAAEWELLRDDRLYRRASAIAMEWHENAMDHDLAGLRKRLAIKYTNVEIVNNIKGLGWLFASNE